MPRKVKIGGKFKLDPEIILIIVLLVILVALVIVYVVTNKPSTSGTITARFTDYKEHFQTAPPSAAPPLAPPVSRPPINRANNKSHSINNRLSNLEQIHYNKFKVYFVYSKDCQYSKALYLPGEDNNSELKNIVSALFKPLTSNNIQSANGYVPATFKGKVELNEFDIVDNIIDLQFEKLLALPAVDENDNDVQRPFDITNFNKIKHHVDGFPTLLLEIYDARTHNTHHIVYQKQISLANVIEWITETCKEYLGDLRRNR